MAAESAGTGAAAAAPSPSDARAQQNAAPPPPRRGPRLPASPSAWRFYARGGETEPPDEAARFWTRELLRRSVGAGNYAQMKALLEKLDAGEPITVAAVGSSVVQDHGGAFHSSLAALRAAVPSPHPYIYGGATGSGGPDWVQTGWLTYFMRAVNATWPHPGHLLVNAGRGGATPAAIANGMCVEQSLPETADLIIIENMAIVDPLVHEQIAWRLIEHYTAPAAAAADEGAAAPQQRRQRRRLGEQQQQHGGAGSGGGGSSSGQRRQRHRPAVILFNTAYVASPPWDCYYSVVPDCCANFTARPGLDYQSGKSDAPHDDLANYYGFGSISHRCGARRPRRGEGMKGPTRGGYGRARPRASRSGACSAYPCSCPPQYSTRAQRPHTHTNARKKGPSRGRCCATATRRASACRTATAS